MGTELAPQHEKAIQVNHRHVLAETTKAVRGTVSELVPITPNRWDTVHERLNVHFAVRSDREREVFGVDLRRAR